MITAYRLTKTKYVGTAFNGEGARRNGGHWNSVGTRMVYVAGSRSLATLEILVHIEDLATIEGAYSLIPVSFPDEVVRRVGDGDLPTGWASPEPTAETQIFGDRWVHEARSAVLEVPSAVANDECNYLINPAHPDSASLSLGTATLFRVDPRLG